MNDANKPASTPLPRVTKQNPSGKDHAVERSIPDSEQAAALETSRRLGEQAGESTTAVRNRESAVAAREETATLREDAADVREGVADLRDETATQRDGAVGVREEAAGLREETSTLREEAVRAREEAAQAKSELEELMAQMREANERLIVGTIRAQTMTEDAEQANHLKDEFLATVSHELRTPLNAVLGWARMLGAKQLPPGRARHAIAIIERNALALAHIIDDLLDVSRIVAGTLRLAPQPVDLVAVAQAALDVVRPLAATKNVQLAFSPDLEVTRTGQRRRRPTTAGDSGICSRMRSSSRLRADVLGSSSNARTTTWRSGSSIRARASARTFCHTCSSASARPMTRRRHVTPDSVSGLPSFGNSLSCTEEPCTRPVKASDAARRSPSVCRCQPARLKEVKRPRSESDGPRLRRPHPCRAYRGLMICASWSSMTTPTGAL